MVEEVQEWGVVTVGGNTGLEKDGKVQRDRDGV
jgi:hypothetical protein